MRLLANRYLNPYHVCMEAQTQNCHNCKVDFTIEPEDFSFYTKINIPPPTFCFDCRLQRRMMFRNERIFYKRDNNAPGKESESIISIHHPESNYTVYDDRTWWGDTWDPMDYGKPYDFSKPFFQQFKDLYQSIPLINLSITNMSNCAYCNVSEGDKGSYMISASNANEDSLYGNRLSTNKGVCDTYIATSNESCYELVSCVKNFKCHYCIHTNECVDSYFLYNCKNCTDCICCVNLRNKSYCIFNQQYTKEEYQKKKDELALDTYAGIEKARKKFMDLVVSGIHKYAHTLKAVDSTGDNIENVSRVVNAFDIINAQDCKNAVWGGYGMKDSMDVGPGVGIQSELLYECFDTALQASIMICTGVVYHSFDVRYSINCHSSSYLFGCHGLRSKKYCILNYQYTKEEYETLLPQIIEHMKTMPYTDAQGRVFTYGEFFPYDISPFAYNETIAHEYFPLSKDTVLQNGWNWYERADRDYAITLSNDAIPERIANVADSVCDDVIECANKGLQESSCTTAFRIVPTELEFYRKFSTPIPHYCPNCRHYNRLKLHNPIKLWQRSCMCDQTTHFHGNEHCTIEFQTSYSPERPEKVYCERCYQQEVI